MKIAILTQPLATNYGGIMQAYAVQKVLRDLGHNVITLDIQQINADIRDNMSPLRQIRAFCGSLMMFCLGRTKACSIFWPFNTVRRNERYQRIIMHPFINNYIKRSPILNAENINEYIEKEKFDAYVVGSDQVWRPCYSPNIDWFYLSFIPKENNAKRIALAASFGVDKWEYSEEQTERIRPLVKMFDAISVREESGKTLCNKYWEENAEVMIDPTMLLSSDDYKQLTDNAIDNTYSMKDCVFTYILVNDKEKDRSINNIASMLNCKVQRIAAFTKLPQYASKKKALELGPKIPEQWLRGFQEAKFVVTDSFHGTVFSILNHRPFIVMANHAAGLARIQTLLKTFGIEDRLIETSDCVNKDWLMHGIDWTRIDNVLNNKRYSAKIFIDTWLK